MPDYTFPSSPVLIEETAEFAIGATGVLRDAAGNEVQIYDLNGSPLPSVTVGPKGAHQPFKADIPDGKLDFGSVELVAISVEAIRAALTAIGIANQALNAALTSVSRLVFAGDDTSTARPNVDGPLLWMCSGQPANAQDIDYWFPLTGTPTSGDVEVTPSPGDSDAYEGSATPDPNDPDAYIFAGGFTPDPNDPDAYIF